MPKSVTLIISFYNRIDFLRLIFAGLELQSSRDFEVIIADDGSRAEIVEDVKSLINNASFQVKHLWQEDDGWQKNTILNKAIVASETDYIIFIDGDCIPHKRFIEEHLNSRTPNQVVCGRRVTLTKKIAAQMDVARIQNRYFHSSLFIKLLLPSVYGKEQTRFRHLIRIKNKNIRKVFLKDKNKGILGCNFSAWKDDLLKINGFDERFIYPGMGEDSDLENRLRNNGVKLVSKKFYVTVYHMYHKPLGPFNEINIQLYNENYQNNVTFTPYGINK
ncbi:MAG: glycosyltransferase [Paludibacter sp.]